MNSPYWRMVGLAGRTFAQRAWAFAFVLIFLHAPLHIASAGEATTVHIRGEGEETSAAGIVQDGLARQDGGMYEVGEREGQPPVMPAATATATPEPAPAVNPIVEFAMAYVGYPYVWAGNSPAGFDCSGFTQFVLLNTFGIDIGHGLEGQPGAGPWVEPGAWLPGDLVFFQNTYRAGLSHVGVYIGDGLFVHAENAGTGVTISSMNSDYYGGRYWGAARVG